MASYYTLNEFSVGMKDGIDMVRVTIQVDTIADIPTPLPRWAPGSELYVLENGGVKYRLSNNNEWLQVNFDNSGGGGEIPADVYNTLSDLQTNKAEKSDVSVIETSLETVQSDILELQTDKANISDVYSKSETDSAITTKVAEIVSGAPEDFDTLQEMSDWLIEHEDSAAAMNTAIQKNTSDISDLQATDDNTSTEIASIKNDVAINRTTLGVQCKNLLPFLASITKKGIVFSCNALGYMSASSTDHDDRQWTYDMAQYSVRLQPGDYILSFHSSTVCTNAYGNIMVLSADSTKLCNIGQSNYVNNTTGVATFTITTEQTVYVMNKVFDGITAIMIRHADITDDTYEPYKPSLQERITTKLFKTNDDLNTYTTAGHYASPGVTVGNTLVNAPPGVLMFNVDVLRCGDYITQIIYPITLEHVGKIYIRRGWDDGASWTSWFEFSGTVVDTATTSE